MCIFSMKGKRGSREEYDRDQQDNRAALRWTVEQINSLITHGRPIDFVVFTGDFGLELVRRTDAEVPCQLSDNDKNEFDKYKKQGWPRFVSMKDAANEVAHEFSRLQVSMIYVLPGNNDLVGEEPCDLGRYTDFVRQVTKAMPTGRPQIVNLIDPGGARVDWKEFRLVGLNSASFKKVTDDPKKDEKNEERKKDALRQIEGLATKIRKDSETVGKSENPEAPLYLIFTHIPELIDPFSKDPASPKPAWYCGIDRTEWRQIVVRKNVAGVFAGHFHSADRLLYATPASVTPLSSDRDTAEKTWVAPPLAIKFQDEPETARGFLLVRVQKVVRGADSTATVAATPFWYEGPRPAMCWCYVLPILSVLVALAFLIWGVSAYIATRNRYPELVRETYPTLLTLVGLAGIAFGIWLIMKFMISDLGLPAMYWAGPIFGAIGGIFGGLGDGETFALAQYAAPAEIRPGILGAVISGVGGSIAVIFVTERALNLQSGNPDSLLWLMSVSFVAGVAGRKLVQLAIDKVLNKQQETKISALQQKVERIEKATATADDAERVAPEESEKAGHAPSGAPFPPP